ncbi:hypothetical protein [Nonomuraea sp. NPDC049695]|uniref:hypothetical protein n=1 Tax=Nonomuraea sp. NPDC049695 TaxID=3154734 RepID=UPI003413666A
MSTDSKASYGTDAAASSMIQFKHGKVEKHGENLADRALQVGKIAQSTEDIHISRPAFGVIGIGLNHAHDSVKDGAVKTLKAAKKALEDYKTALAEMEKNYRKPDEDNADIVKKIGSEDGGVGGGPGRAPNVPMPKGPSFPSADYSPREMSPADYSPPKVSPADYAPPEAPSPDAPSTPMPPADRSTMPVPGANATDPTSSIPTASRPSIEDQLNHEVPTSAPTTHSTNPNATDLASYKPIDVNIPTGTSPYSSGTSLGPGMLPTGTPSGGSLGGSGAGAMGTAAAAAGRAGAAGMSGMPMMPMMPGGAPADQHRKDERDYVRGGEEIWQDDNDIAPPVIGIGEDDPSHDGT